MPLIDKQKIGIVNERMESLTNKQQKACKYKPISVT